MCVIERRVYTYTDGPSRTVESTKYCHRAVGKRLCSRVDRRETTQALVVERRPSTADGPPDTYILTEGTNGRTRVYRDLSNRSSHVSSVRQSTASERSQPSIPSSASSPPDPVRSLDPAADMYAERQRAPYPPSMPVRTVGESGTAIYDRPPSLGMPRASENERRPARQASNSSMTAEVNDYEPSPPPPSIPPPRRRRPSVRIDTDPRPPASATPNSASTRSSSNRVPRRQDSHRTSRPQPDRERAQERAQERERRRRQEEDDRQAELERDRRRQEEEDRQAELERDRLAASDRRQSVREEQYRSEQRREEQRRAEQHRTEQRRDAIRREALETLEGQRPPPMSPTQARQEAEYAQMARERAAAAARRDSADAAAYQYAQEQLRRDEQARAQFWSTRNPSDSRVRPPSSRRMTGDSFGASSSPVSARSSTNRPPLPPVVHQGQSYTTTNRHRSSFSMRGESVIAREQARAAHEELNRAMGGMRVDDAVGEYEYDEYADGYVPVVEEYEYITYSDGRRERRRRRHV